MKSKMANVIQHRFFIPILLLLSLAARSQSIEGTVTDSLQGAVPYIPLALLNARDSSIVKGSSTDENGHFKIANIRPGTYLIKIDALGFNPMISSVYTLDTLTNVDLGTIVIYSSALNLNEVNITSMKKLVEFKNGNIVVNVENSPLAVGNSLYDLLLRLPTVTILDDAISIQGKSGIRILIDERLQQMTGQPLINLLKSIQASSVEKIEILKNPPVKYDAAGSGFISVKTKKLKITGFSGTTNWSYQQGFYANRDGSFSLNYKGKAFAVFSSLNAGISQSRYTSHFIKDILFNGITTTFDQLTVEKSSHRYVGYSIGADWYINTKNTAGFRIDGNDGRALFDRKGTNELSDASMGYDMLEFSNLRPNSWNYINYNLNAEHLFDTLGTALRFSFDYSPNRDLNSGDFENYFRLMGTNNQLAPRIFKSDNDLGFVIYTSRIDFEKQFGKVLKLEAGVKGNDQNMTTLFNFNNRNAATGEITVDTALTNGFNYREQIYAGYVNLQKDYKKFNFQAGLRGENTAIQAGSSNKDIVYTRNYFNLFPMGSISWNPSEKHSYQLSYNRRINRPGYSMFNPYKYFVNLFVSVQGNPNLTPEYYHSMEFTHGYKSFFYNTVSYNQVQNNFFGYPQQNDSTKETLQLTSNLGQMSFYGYSTFIQKDIKKWWMLTFNGYFSYVTFSGKIDGRDYSNKAFQSYLSLTSQFNLPKSIKLELSSRYIPATQTVISKNKDMWAVDLAFRRTFLKDKLTVAVGVNDLFYTWTSGSKVDYLNIHSTVRATYDSRRFKVNLSYAFGKVKVRQRQTTSNQEEKGRLSH